MTFLDLLVFFEQQHFFSSLKEHYMNFIDIFWRIYLNILGPEISNAIGFLLWTLKLFKKNILNIKIIKYINYQHIAIEKLT